MLAWLHAEGFHRDIGFALGRWGAAACHSHLLASPAWASVLQWRNSPEATAMRRYTEQAFPWIWEELTGLAQGLDLPLEDVFLWNCRGDLWAQAPDGCTTVLAAARLSHNEDGDPGFAGRCGLVEVRPLDAPGFVSFVYPGSIPGHTFAVNTAGLAMTVNNIRARHATAGMPRMVLTRALLATSDPEDAVKVLRSHPRAGAFHLSLGMAARGGTHSVEFSAMTVSVERVSTGRRIHANHAIHVLQAGLPQIVTASSRHRQVRGEQLLSQGMDALGILADQGDAAEPIYRNSATDTDGENTMATADLDLSGPQVLWTVHAPPGTIRYRLQGTQRL